MNKPAGKGSAQRPILDRKQFEENWNAIFHKVPNTSSSDGGSNVIGSSLGGEPRKSRGQEGSPTGKPAE